MFGRNGLVDKDAGGVGETVGGFGGQIAAGAAFGAIPFDLRMTNQIVGEAVGYQFALGNDGDWVSVLSSREARFFLGSRFSVLDFQFSEVGLYLVQQQGIVRAAEDDGVDKRVAGEEFVQVFPHKEIRAVAVMLAGLDERHPKGARLLSN